VGAWRSASTGAARVHSELIFGTNDASRTAETSDDFPELECVRSLLPLDVIDTATARAAILGIGADRILIAGGNIDEETYLRALAGQLGVTFEPLDGVSRAMCPVADERLIEAAAQGMVPLSTITVLAAVYGTSVIIGYLTSAFLGWLGLMRRGLLSTAWVLLLMPLHWLLLSLAAWRALYQLIVAPYVWEKTEHGLAKTSRLNGDMTRALLELERHLTELERSGALPTVSNRAKGTSSNRRLSPRAAA
jgi:hypothetical protein